MKKYINPLLTFGTTMALLYVIYGQNEQLTKLKSEQVKIYKVPSAVDSLQNIIDSLQSEAFSAQTQNGRYELARTLWNYDLSDSNSRKVKNSSHHMG